MMRLPYPHPGYGRKPYPIQTVLRDLAAQEHCDGEPYDAMVYAAHLIDMLLDSYDHARKQADDLAKALLDVQKELSGLKDQVREPQYRVSTAGIIGPSSESVPHGKAVPNVCPHCGGRGTSPLDGACMMCGEGK